ncbi:MAG: hypothetical protein JXB00_01095 [Bacteroidales bacterium]|nr:hypothetical protein [Bacteroidales bacterium]
MKNQLAVFWGIIFTAVLSGSALAQRNWSPEHVYYGEGGILTYTPDESGNTIPDFSHVGYRYGDSTLSDIPVKVEIIPVEGDDGASIQAAIDSVAAMTPDVNGFRGAVLLKAGTYEVAGQIIINTSGIVLRGEGQTDEGTVIIAAGTGQRDLIKVDNGSSRSINYSPEARINENYVPVGRKYLIVNNASGFAPGDQIVIYRQGTDQWITDIKMDQITQDGDVVQWSPSSFNFYFERLITKVSGDTIFFRNPVVMAMETKYGGGKVYKFSFNRLEHIGIENICLKSAYLSETDEDHSWKAIAFYSVENGWIRNITSWYFAFGCVSLERNSRLITVINCHHRESKSIITGNRRYSFCIAGSMNLVKNCTTTEGRHDFVTDSRVCGPNVFTNCSAVNTYADIGPHHRWAMGTLYDLVLSEGEINVQDRDDMGSGHGWAGANQVFWNCAGSSSVCQSPWASALNYNFGFTGEKSNGYRTGRPDGEWVGHNIPGIYPASLYEAQLDQRLNNTTVFSVYNNLVAQSDTSFVMSFNMPFNVSTIVKENFNANDIAGSEGKEFEISVMSENSVLFTFTGLGILPAFTNIVIEAMNITSENGKSLEGLNSSIYTEPDKRPVVTGLEMTVNNEDGFLIASSSKPGSLYIIKYGEKHNTAGDLDSAVMKNMGRKVDSPVANVSKPIYTKGLPGGFYNYYAIDLDNRVSDPAQQWAQVNETGPVTGIPTETLKDDFAVWHEYGVICVNPKEVIQNYSLLFFDMNGRLLDAEKDLAGYQRISLEGKEKIVIVQIISSKTVCTRKIILP